MECLHQKPASCSTTEKDSFWFCGQSQTCHCSEDNGYLYEKAIAAWTCTNQPHPVCGGHNKRVVKDMMKESYGNCFLCVLKETVHVPSGSGVMYNH